MSSTVDMTGWGEGNYSMTCRMRDQWAEKFRVKGKNTQNRKMQE